MRRVMLLTLLAVALTTAAFANSINFTKADKDANTDTFVTGTFSSGSIGTCIGGGCATLGPGFTLTVTGNNGTLTISGGTLSPSTCSSGVCTFSGATVTFTDTSGTLLFSDGITAASFTKSPGTGSATRVITSLSGSLADGGTVSLISPTTIGWVGHGGINSGAPIMVITPPSQVIPEPGTLGLLGTGVIGLATIARRKVRRGAEIGCS